MTVVCVVSIVGLVLNVSVQVFHGQVEGRAVVLLVMGPWIWNWNVLWVLNGRWERLRDHGTTICNERIDGLIVK